MRSQLKSVIAEQKSGPGIVSPARFFSKNITGASSIKKGPEK